MNEQFDKMIYESGLIAQGCWDKFDEYDRQALHKFAELIVRECANIADEPTSRPFDSYCKKIKEHFGVKP